MGIRTRLIGRLILKSRPGPVRVKGNTSLFKNFSRGASFNGHLNQDFWEESYTQIIDEQTDKAGNSGQETVLKEYFAPAAEKFCKEKGEQFDPDAFIEEVKFDMGDDYYYAVNEIIEECSYELYEAWDWAYSNDGVGDALYGPNYFSSKRTTYGNYSNALANYQSNARAKYGANWNTTAASRARSAETARDFLKKNPKGTARTNWVSGKAQLTRSQYKTQLVSTINKWQAQNPGGRSSMVTNEYIGIPRSYSKAVGKNGK